MGWSVADIPDLTGEVAVVTGGTDGLGREVARGLAVKGARVIVAGRNAGRGGAIAREIGGVFERLDLADLANVRDFAARVTARHPRLDILVNNAGVAMIPDLTRTADGFEMQFGTNFLGPFALTAALMPALIANGAGRVVNVSSIAAAHVAMDFDQFLSERGYKPGKVYGWSKLAMLLFAQELDARARARGWPVTAVAAHPGVAESNLQTAGPSLNRASPTLVTRIGTLVTGLIGQSTVAGALPLLRAATDPNAAGGSYYGPDGWGGIKGSPIAMEPPKSARDPALGRRLWAIAEERTATRWPD